ncbi:MAG TPA: hypothetical protein VJA66_13805, partial [Thermoanaerobaculia bacterium]
PAAPGIEIAHLEWREALPALDPRNRVGVQADPGEGVGLFIAPISRAAARKEILPVSSARRVVPAGSAERRSRDFLCARFRDLAAQVRGFCDEALN